MAEQPVAQCGQDAAGAGARVKRRGILAAAGAVVAALLATRTSQPVAAGGTDNQALVIAQPNTESGAGTSLSWTGGTIVSGAALAVSDGGAVTAYTAMVSGTATAGKAGYGVYGEGGFSPSGAGVAGVSTDGLGVIGTSANYVGVEGFSTSNAGVFGKSSRNTGVYGATAAAGGGNAGVYGAGNGSGTFGVVGDGSSIGAGAVGVQGQGAQYGVVGHVNNAPNTVAIYGNNTSTGTGGIGVVGASATGAGVYGNSSGPYGVAGGTSAPNGYGGYFATAGSQSYGFGAQVQGTPTGSVALYASAPANNTAGYFTGDVYINGSLTVANMANKHGLLRAPDGTAHLLYTMEAPESWAEDFGTGTLTNGKASVALEPLFASLVQTDDYHVFVTAHSDQHLHVSQRGAAGFTIEADLKVATLKGQAASELNGTFSWRVVAKPKGGTVERLGKYVVPAEPRQPPPLPKLTAPPPPSVPPPVPPKKP